MRAFTSDGVGPTLSDPRRRAQDPRGRRLAPSLEPWFTSSRCPTAPPSRRRPAWPPRARIAHRRARPARRRRLCLGQGPGGRVPRGRRHRYRLPPLPLEVRPFCRGLPRASDRELEVVAEVTADDGRAPRADRRRRGGVRAAGRSPPRRSPTRCSRSPSTPRSRPSGCAFRRATATSSPRPARARRAARRAPTARHGHRRRRARRRARRGARRPPRRRGPPHDALVATLVSSAFLSRNSPRRGPHFREDP